MNRIALSLLPRWKRGVKRSLILTVEGVIFIPLMASVGLAAINTGANLLYMVFAMMAALMTVSALASWINLRALDIRRIVPDGVSVDETARIGIELTNRKMLFHSYSLRVIDALDTKKPTGVAYLFRLPVRKTARVDYPTTFERRGRHRFSRIRISSRFPFGFTEKSVSWIEPDEILVFPKVYPAAGFLERQGIALGDIESGRRGNGASLYALRDYRPEDSSRMIHWKVSARRGSLVIREMEAEDNLKVSLILDNFVPEKSVAPLAENFEKAVSCLASIANELMQMGYQIEVLTRTGRVPFDQGQGHMKRILRAMAIVELGARESAPMQMSNPEPGTMVFWFEYGQSNFAPADAACIDARDWPPTVSTPDVDLKEAV